ncbi:MAG TPA: VWA domain-containing protein [Ferruginibacter sp.]|nr:VWA domain-containing protein [Ferruginibacter sp.]HRE62181.1 VWA domain-containing protein [Ferruginibacter sp.]
MLQFQYNLLLAVLALVPLAIIMYFFARSKKKKSIKAIGDSQLVGYLLKQYNARSFFQKFLLVTVSLTALILALANLRSPTGSEKVNRAGIDVMIAIDVSKSMLAQDISPTRLDRAKQMLGRLVDKLGNDRIGIVIFAGKAYLQMPLTADLAAAKMYLSSASTQSVPTQGTVIGEALKMCFASFDSKEKKYKAVVLVSDGEDHDEEANDIAGQMSSEGVVIYTVGIGSPGGSPIIDTETGEMKKDALGNTVISKLNEDGLKSIAKKGNGKYMLYNNTESVANTISHQLATMDQKVVKDDSLTNYRSYYQWLLALALLLLIAELFISEVKNIRAKKLLKPAISILLTVLSIPCWAQSDKQEIKKGNEAYAKKEYKTAATTYNKVAQKNPENATAQYNLGNALYKDNKKTEAIAAYDKSISKLNKPVEKSNAYYNKAVVLHNENKLPECITAYKEALKLDPNNEDARQNLQKALKKQKEQQQKQRDKKEEQKQQNKEQQQKPKPQPSKLNKQEAEERLKALMQKEKNLQDKLHKVNSNSPNKPEKDW